MNYINPLRDKCLGMTEKAQAEYLDRLRAENEGSEYFYLFLWACEQLEAATVRDLQLQTGPDAATNATLATGRLQALPLLTTLFLAHTEEDEQEDQDARRPEYAPEPGLGTIDYRVQESQPGGEAN